MRDTTRAREYVEATPSMFPPFIIVREDRHGRVWQVHRLWHPGLWRHVWTAWRGRRSWATRWHVRNRKVRIE